MCQSPYRGLVGEYIVLVSESLGPGTGSNFLNFGSISASVQQKTSRLGRSLSGEHTALGHLKMMFWVCHLNSMKDTFVVVVDFFPPSIATVSGTEIALAGTDGAVKLGKMRGWGERSLPL